MVAGATGSGKSVLIQASSSILQPPIPVRLAQIILIDPKMGVDYAAVERLPHIHGGIIIDQGTRKTELECLVAEMERRYELFRANGARDLRSSILQAGAGEASACCSLCTTNSRNGC